MNAHENSGEFRDQVAELRKLREQVQAIAGGTAATTPVLGVVTGEIPVIRAPKIRRYDDGGPASA